MSWEYVGIAELVKRLKTAFWGKVFYADPDDALQGPFPRENKSIFPVLTAK